MENQYVYLKRLGVTFSINISDDVKDQILASHKEFRMFNQMKVGVAFKKPSDNHCKKTAREVSDKDAKLEMFVMERVDISRDGNVAIFSVDEMPLLGEIESEHENSWVSRLMEFRGFNLLLFRLVKDLKPHIVVDKTKNRIWAMSKHHSYNYLRIHDKNYKKPNIFKRLLNTVLHLFSKGDKCC